MQEYEIFSLFWIDQDIEVSLSEEENNLVREKKPTY